jgi:hypothetical protein
MNDSTISEVKKFLGQQPASVPVSRVIEVLQLNEKNFGVDPQYIVDKYKLYNKWWRATYITRDKQYLTKEEKKVDLFTFMSTKLYENAFEVSMTERDKYIFSDEIDMYTAEDSLIKLLNSLDLPVKT